MINSESYIKDLERQIGRINLSDFKDTKVLVTGAAGLICSYIVDMFILANKKYDANITIMALSRTEESLKSRFDYYFDNELFIPVIQDVCSPCEVDVDYIIHNIKNRILYNKGDKYAQEKNVVFSCLACALRVACFQRV